VFLFTFFGLVLFNAAATGAKNIWTLLIFRFLGGAFGSAPLSNAGGVVADLFNAKDRGLAMSVFSVAPFMGPVLGPIISGFLGQARGWVWVEGFMAIFSGAVFFIAVFIVPETYAPALLRKRAETLSKQTGKVYYTRMDVDQGRKQFGEVFATGLKRPWILLFTEPIVLLLSLYMVCDTTSLML
jgi:MFS family permease